MPFFRRRWTMGIIGVLLAGAASFAIPDVRAPVLRSVGRSLVVEEPLASADVAVVATGSDGAGVLEAADLAASGIVKGVAVFEDPPDALIDREFLRRGLPYEDEAARSIRQLQLLGVKSIEVIPMAVAGTEDEGKVLPGWCDQRRIGSIIIVTTADHSRRMRRVLGRAMKGHTTRVTVRGSRYSPFSPDSWWHARDTRRTGIVEMEKLLLDVVQHPF